jgi:hypothetical protein
MAYKEGDEEHLDRAFAAAAAANFQLFFSFDYAGGDHGPWEAEAVTRLIRKFGKLPAYYKYQGKPFVSTFEGPSSSNDWIRIKKDTGCFFMPDWSSLGAKAALALSNGVADGLFSWAAWPWGNKNMNTYTDASYEWYLKPTGREKPYMMPVSPWFFTNMPGFHKDWVWRGKRAFSFLFKANTCLVR